MNARDAIAGGQLAEYLEQIEEHLEALGAAQAGSRPAPRQAGRSAGGERPAEADRLGALERRLTALEEALGAAPAEHGNQPGDAGENPENRTDDAAAAGDGSGGDNRS